MDTTQEGGSLVTRRNLLIFAAGLAAVGIAGTGAGYYFFGPQPTTAAPQPAPGAEVSSADLLTPGPLGDKVLGPANAPVTIIEYASMTCPHCAHFHETTYPELKKKYIDTGKVRFIFREFPLDPLAAAGFMLARCAGKDKYLPDDRDAVRAAERLGGAEAAAADAGDRQAGRLHPGELRRVPGESGGAQTASRRCASGRSRSSASSPRRPSSSTARSSAATLTIEELDKQIAPYLKG